MTMIKGFKTAVAKLEVRSKGRRTAADLFRGIEPLDEASAGEMRRAIQEARESARTLEATQGPPEL
jgi:hypothetical protein